MPERSVDQMLVDIHEKCNEIVYNERRRKSAADEFFEHERQCPGFVDHQHICCSAGFELAVHMCKLWEGWV